MGRGKFIVFEGIDGSGKTTIQNAVCDRLRESGKSVFSITNIGEYENNTTILSRAIRDKINNKEVSNTYELVYLYLSALVGISVGIKNQRDSIAELLDRYDYVVCSRWIYSTMVYGLGKEFGEEDKHVCNIISDTYTYDKLARPDLVLIIDVELETIVERLNARDPEVDYFSGIEKIKLHHDRYNNLRSYMQIFFPKAMAEWSTGLNVFRYVSNNKNHNNDISKSIDTAVCTVIDNINKLGA